jgi:hypothetical protein
MGRAASELSALAVSRLIQPGLHFIRAHAAGWRNPKHAQQWANSLETYAQPVMGALLV